MVVASLILAALVTPPIAARVVDSVPAAACEQLAASVTAGSRTADLAAALRMHQGVVRWAHDGASVRVWLQRRPVDGASLAYGESEWRAALVSAVAAWDDVAPGLRLSVTRDSATADVRFVWTPMMAAAPANDARAGSFAATGLGAWAGSFTAGRTLLIPDETGRAQLAHVVVALAAPDGTPYSPRDVHAIAQHEIGHALGLAHHGSPRSVMSPMIAVDRVGGDDRAVLRALYALPVGATCRSLGTPVR